MYGLKVRQALPFIILFQGYVYRLSPQTGDLGQSAVLRAGSLQGDHNETSHDHAQETCKDYSHCGVGLELVLNKRYLSILLYMLSGLITVRIKLKIFVGLLSEWKSPNTTSSLGF